MSEKEYMRGWEVAELLDVSLDFVRRRYRAYEKGDPNGLPGHRLGGPRSVVRFRKSEIEAWVDRNNGAGPGLRAVNG